MPDTTGAFIDKNDSNLSISGNYCEIRLDLIRDYMDDQPAADLLRIYTGTYSQAPTNIAVLIEGTTIRYYSGGGGEDLIEHITPVTS